MCEFDGVQRSNNFGRDPVRETEVEVRVKKLKNGKAASKDQFKGEMIRCGGDMVVGWIWRLRNLVFKSCVVSEDCSTIQG